MSVSPWLFFCPTNRLSRCIHSTPCTTAQQLHIICPQFAEKCEKNKKKKMRRKKWQCFDNIFIQVTIRMHFRQFFWQTTCEYTYIYISYTLTHLYSRSISACTSQAKIFPNIDRCTPGTTTVCVCVCKERIKYHLKIFYLKSNNELLAKINK